MKVAVGLAKCGFGDELVDACHRLVKEDGDEDEEGRERLEGWLVGWRERVATELKKNSMGYLPSKRASLAQTLLAFNNDLPSHSKATKSKSKSKLSPLDETTFPSLTVLLYYTRPITSETYHKSARNKLQVTWDREPDLGKIANICETYFEWGYKDMIIKRYVYTVFYAKKMRPVSQ